MENVAENKGTRETKDDNEEIIDKLVKCNASDILPALNARLSLGRKRYGHGVIVDSDTTTYGTTKNDWLEMAHEEFYDGIVYLTAEEIRRNRDKSKNSGSVEHIVQARAMLINAIRLLEESKNI